MLKLTPGIYSRISGFTCGFYSLPSLKHLTRSSIKRLLEKLYGYGIRRKIYIAGQNNSSQIESKMLLFMVLSSGLKIPIFVLPLFIFYCLNMTVNHINNGICMVKNVVVFNAETSRCLRNKCY